LVDKILGPVRDNDNDHMFGWTYLKENYFFLLKPRAVAIAKGFTCFDFGSFLFFFLIDLISLSPLTVKAFRLPLLRPMIIFVFGFVEMLGIV